MENNLFIHKYQPIFLNDFEIEPDMSSFLKTMIETENLNILFVGEIGSGKTSFLNAIIREYYGKEVIDENDENILSINSLKEQGIQYFRNDVKTFCQTCCTVAHKKKTVVMDNIDYINEQSQQIFRNYLDKYSQNVNFIASCSNIQKVIESLQSRFFILKCKPLRRENIHKIMEKIKTTEQILIDTDAEEYILNLCNNSAKILINYMEKLKLLDTYITYDVAMQVCTNISFTYFEDYTIAVKKPDYKNAIEALYKLYDNGYSVIDILDNYFLFVKICTILSEDEKFKIIPILCKYISIFNNIHEEEIELALLTNNLIQTLKNDTNIALHM